MRNRSYLYVFHRVNIWYTNSCKVSGPGGEVTSTYEVITLVFTAMSFVVMLFAAIIAMIKLNHNKKE